jgi:hypothetical protein
MIEKLRNFAPGKKTYTVFGVLFGVAIAGFFGLDLSPVAGWVVPGQALPTDVLEAVNVILSAVVAIVSAFGVILRFLTDTK